MGMISEKMRMRIVRMAEVTPTAALPKIEVFSPDGTPFDLNAAVAKQPTILILYRGGW